MHKKFFFVLLILFGKYTFGLSQLAYYGSDSIPDNLKENAHVVKRFEQIGFEVSDIDRTVYTVHQVLTVLDDQGEESLFFREYTDKLRSLEEVEIRLYNSAGKLISKYNKKDLLQQAAQSELVQDGFYQFLKITSPEYPVTVEYKYKIISSGTVSYPRYIIGGINESVQYSSFTAKVTSDIGLRYKQQKTTLEPQVTSEGKYKVFKWEINQLSALKEEKGSVGYQFYCPAIILAPNKFRHFNTYGDMSSWKSFGTWGYELLNGLEVLPEDRKAFFINLVKDAGSDKEKVAIIYDYLQKNFRYVSIQLGIGGVKPFSAKFTDEKKYGDCKGLSFYMHAVLEIVGIKSYTAFINARYNQEAVDPDFPCDRFDHVILCVPQPKDSIWLECTSNTSEFNELGTFTENKNALLLTENGGVLVATPKSKSSSNTITALTTVTLKEDGSGNTITSLYCKGQFNEIMNEVVAAKRDEQKTFLVNYMGFKQPDDFSVVNKSVRSGQQSEISLEIEKIPAIKSGDKMFLTTRLYELWNVILPNADDRKQDYYFQYPFEKTDTTIYNLPADYVANVLPPAVTKSCDYGSYTTSYWYDKDKNQLFSVAKFILKNNRIPATKYADVKKFFDGVMGDGGQKIIIKKA